MIAEEAMAGRSLLRDDRGAMMIMSVFMATICIGMLYYLTGIGEVLTFRERMQDASDAGAMVGSITMARSMNVIAMLNIALAMLFSVSVMAYRAAHMIDAGGAAASAACVASWGSTGCGAAFCLLLGAGNCAANQAVDNGEDVVEDNKGAIETLMNRVNGAAPAYAGAVASSFVANNYAPPVGESMTNAVTIPHPTTLTRGLPTESDSRRKVMCDQLDRGDNVWQGSVLRSHTSAINITAMALASHIALDECNGEAAAYVAGAAAVYQACSSDCWASRACRRAHRATRPRPRRLQESVGTSRYQFYSLAIAPEDNVPVDVHSERVAAPVLWGQTAEDPTIDLRGLAPYAVAQSEFYPHFEPDDQVRCRRGSNPRENLSWGSRYYCNEEDERYYEDDFIWTPKWRGRLRRTNINGIGEICGSLGGFCSAINNLVAH